MGKEFMILGDGKHYVVKYKEKIYILSCKPQRIGDFKATPLYEGDAVINMKYSDLGGVLEKIRKVHGNEVVNLVKEVLSG